MGYFSALNSALFRHGISWWLSLLVAYIFGIGVFSEYPQIKEAIDGVIGRPLMPPTVPFWWIAIPFLLWITGALAHREAMRSYRAARVLFGAPYVNISPLFAHSMDGSRHVIHNFSMAKVDVRNAPYRADDGKDVVDAWSEIEVFDLASRPIASWRYGRWEENNQPGYQGNPTTHYPDKENIRTLAANEKPHILCLAIKPFQDEEAYPIRGADQLKPGWRSDDVKLPRGQFLIRLRIHGKGLQAPAEKTFLLTNNGTNAVLDLADTTKKIHRYWPSSSNPSA
jgi:hypothetical protein